MLVRVIDESAAARAEPAGDDVASAPAGASLWELLVIASRSMGAYWWHTAQGTGVSPAGLGILRMLALGDGLKSSEVATRGWSAPGTVTSVVDTLARDGLVERRRDEEDRRVVRLYLTDTGRHKVDEAAAILGPKWRNAFDYLAPADEPAVRKFLADTIERFGMLIRKERGT
jgi:DNA-binding MarR family transcriptional regulator